MAVLEHVLDKARRGKYAIWNIFQNLFRTRVLLSKTSMNMVTLEESNKHNFVVGFLLTFGQGTVLLAFAVTHVLEWNQVPSVRHLAIDSFHATKENERRGFIDLQVEKTERAGKKDVEFLTRLQLGANEDRWA